MAALHAALQSLNPTPFSSVPSSQSEAAEYLQNAFIQAQTIIDSVPLPPESDPLFTTRPRSSTSTSMASNVSEISSSSARSDPLDPAHVPLQKEWGKPIKLAPKDNPLGMAVYKLGGKDGNGAWFARRSVHEGLGFKKWKLGLQREFPETLEVQGRPGEGNIRGIGGERRVERMDIKGTGVVEVYHLSAQFPGPTTPRDFVTLLLTSSSALSPAENTTLRPSSPVSDTNSSNTPHFSDSPRHFMVISRPCQHPDCPPRNGFIRGQYESVEFIREIPKKPKLLSSSTTDLTKKLRAAGPTSALDEASLLRKAERVTEGSTESLAGGEKLSPALAEDIVAEGRKRGKTISFAGSRGAGAKGEVMDNPHVQDEDETNPVEWIMITRSDPGGSVPRFMVERGTPGSIVADASKFLDWACKKEHPEEVVEALEKGDTDLIMKKTRTELEAYETNGHLAGIDGSSGEIEPPAVAVLRHASLQITPPIQETHNEGLLSVVRGAALAGIESYAPQAVIDRLPGHQQTPSMSSSAIGNLEFSVHDGSNSLRHSPTISSISSVGSFASAEDHFESDEETRSITSQSKSPNSQDTTSKIMTPHEKELAKLNERKRQLNERLSRAREKEMKDKEELTSKEEERIRKAEEKHAKEVSKQEQKYEREVAKLEAKRQKEAAREEERKRKTQVRDEKSRLIREKEELRQQLDFARKERDILREQVSALQKENTSLVVRLGKMEEGKDLLREVKKEVEGSRSRSGSLKRSGEVSEKGKEATVLSRDEKEVVDAMK